MGRPAQYLWQHPLAYLRAQRKWTYRELVELVADRVGGAARPEKAWRWEHRGAVPDMPTQEALAAEFQVPVEELTRRPWPAWLPVGDPVPMAQWTVSGCIAVLDQTVGGPMDRRGFLTLGAGGAATLATAWAETPAPPVETDRGSRAAVDLVADLERRLPLLRAMEDREGGTATRAILDGELRTATELVRSGSCGSATGRLLAVIAELSRTAGWAHVDAGQDAAAERRFAAGLRASHAAGDRLAGANLLKCMSLLLLDHGRAAEALQVAQTARAVGGPPRVQAMLTVREARAHAALGDAHTCERLLADAETAMGRADDEGPGWAHYFDDAEFAAQVAACHLGLGLHRSSDRWLEQALGLQPPERERDGVTYLMWHAVTATHLGEVDRACDYLHQALPRLADGGSVRNLHQLAEARAALRPYRTDRLVKELDERTHALIA